MLWLFWHGLMQGGPIDRLGLAMLALAAILACSWLRFIRLGNLRQRILVDDSPRRPPLGWAILLANLALIVLIAIAAALSR